MSTTDGSMSPVTSQVQSIAVTADCQEMLFLPIGIIVLTQT